MSIDEFRTLQSDEGAAQFIAQRTGLSYERVLRIYRLGNPWPLGGGEEWNFGRQATEAGTDVYSVMAALAPLMDMAIEEKRAKLDALEQMVARGNQPSPEQLTELDAEFGNPELREHVEKVANLTNESTEVIHQVYEGFLAVFRRLNELTQEVIETR